MKSLRQFLDVPDLGEPEKNRQARLLNIILLAMGVAVAGYSLFAPIDPALWPRRLIIVGPFFALLVLLWLAVRRGHVRAAGYTVVVATWAMLTVAMILWAGYENPAFFGYILVVVCAGLLIGRQAAIIWAFIGSATSAGIILASQAGYLEKHSSTSDGAFWVAQTVYILVTAVLLSLALQSIDDAMSKAQTELDERKRVEEEIRQLNAELEWRVKARTGELEAFSYSVSHDLRAPLRSIDGFTKILLNEYGKTLDAQGLAYLERVRHGVVRMNQLIEDLLMFSRLGQQEISRTMVNMDDLVAEVLEELGPEYEDREVAWQVASLPVCMADRSLMKQVLFNLMHNAVKYTRTRTVASIEMGAKLNGEEWIYFIRDNGVGFDMKYANKLFGVFQRLHREDEFEGTGVGLATVQQILRRHGGKIWAESEPGRGAAFFFALPSIAQVRGQA